MDYKLSNKNMNKLIASSENPEKISLTLKGATVILAVYLFNQAGIDFSETEILTLIEALTIISGSLVTVYGFLRKIYNL